MIQSMTGYGRAHEEGEHFSATAEIRSVNNRFLKVSVRLPEVWDRLSTKIEALVKGRLARGSVFVNLRKSGSLSGTREFVVNGEAIAEYRRQLAQVSEGEEVPLSEMLALPGVVGVADESAQELDEVWEHISGIVVQAIDAMVEMRQREGENLHEVLRSGTDTLRKLVAQIRNGAPDMVSAYRDRLTSRVEELLRDVSVNVSETDLARELAVFAERSDIREEVDRMTSHLKQFETLLDADGPVGRRLEFLVQEMFRETNTMGSKVADVELARTVLDAKTEVDRLKEQVMNVE